MNSDDSMALLREYAQSNSEQAFTTLVSRHVDLVYSVALRQVRDAHLAEEITQTVFITLAKKANSLSPKTILSGWLCRTARYVSADTLKFQRRRQFREQESYMQSTLNQPDSAAWNQIAPLLDEALDRIAANEHDALVLRFLDGKEMKHVGAAMGVSEDAARMRVNRGLEKLREFFTRKGVALSAAAIAGAVSSHSVQAAPTGLTGTIAASVFSGTALTTSAVIAATKTVAMTTLQKTLLTAAIAAAVGISLYETRRSSQLSAALAELQQARTDQGASTQPLEPVAHSQPLPSRGSPPDQSELLRLRGQVAALRTQLREQSTSPALNQWLASVRPLSPRDFPDSFQTAYASTCTNAGTATPGALIQTWLWALRTGDSEGLLAVCDFPEHTTDEEKLRAVTNQKAHTSDFEEYTLSTLLPLGNDFFLALLTVDGSKLGPSFRHTTKQYFRRFDGYWKITNYPPQIFQQQ